ncbi:MAG: hypothetical protein ACOVO9_12345 [Bacteroidia bacterium]
MAYLFFFFNNTGLPGGLLFSNLMSPFLYVWLIYKKKQPVLWPLLFFLLPFDLIHIILGIEWKSFLTSNLLFLSTYIFAYSFYYFLQSQENIGHIFKRILVANFGFAIFACFVYFTPYKETLWYMNKFTQNVEGFYRLSLLTFEASYYSFLFAPIAIYYVLKVLLGLNNNSPIGLLILVFVPLMLSLSFGVLGALVISFLILYIIHFQKVFYKRGFFSWLVLGLLLFVSITISLILFFPENPLFLRLSNIYNGIDSSTKGRTTDSFGIAWEVARERSIWFGSGLGQVKVLAFDIVKKYYNYWGDLPVVRIPNSIAETIAIFGIFGLIIRFVLIFYFFFKTNVLNNYYRTVLFFFVFIYQFTGSYITSHVEYVIWILAFSSAFEQFDITKKSNRFSIQKPSE